MKMPSAEETKYGDALKRTVSVATFVQGVLCHIFIMDLSTIVSRKLNILKHTS